MTIKILKKQEILGGGQQDCDEFLKQFNLKRNKNGTVSKIDEE